VTSGLRIGSPALTTRGLGREDFLEIGEIIGVALGPDFEPAAASCSIASSRSLIATRCTQSWRLRRRRSAPAVRRPRRCKATASARDSLTSHGVLF